MGGSSSKTDDGDKKDDPGWRVKLLESVLGVPELSALFGIDSDKLMKILTYTGIAVVIAAAVAGSAYVLGGVSSLPGALESVYEIATFPLTIIEKTTVGVVEEGISLLGWIPEATHTYKEMWIAAGVSLVIWVLTDLAYVITKSLWGAQEKQSLWWTTFNFFNTWILWMVDQWEALIPAKWNPLHWIIWFPAVCFEIILLMFLPLMVLLNPTFIWGKLSALFTKLFNSATDPVGDETKVVDDVSDKDAYNPNVPHPGKNWNPNTYHWE